MSSSAIVAFRWIAVVPAAIAAYFISGLAFYIGGEGHPDAIMMLAHYCISPALCVFCGAKVAPKRRFGTSIVLTILWTITVTALFTWSATARGYDNWFQTSKSLIWAILGIVSMLVTCFLIHQTEEEDRLLRDARKAGAESSPKTGQTEKPPEPTFQVNDPYAILGVQQGASFEEIRRAYRERMKEYHPDKVAALGKELRELAERKAKEINMAFEQLRNIHEPI